MGRIPAANQVTLTDSTPNGKIIAQAMTALAGGTTYPMTPSMQYYNVSMDIALRSILEGKTPSSQALQTANDDILAALSATPGTPTPAP